MFFWALGICDTFLQHVKKVESLSWEDLVKVGEETITTLPAKINPFRDTTKRYDPLEAKAILRANNLLATNLLATNYELSEECTSSDGVFTKLGRKGLINAHSKHDSTETTNRRLSVDESMILFKGRHSIKQYNPMKPIKRSYKLGMRADMDGYVTKFDMSPE